MRGACEQQDAAHRLIRGAQQALPQCWSNRCLQSTSRPREALHRRSHISLSGLSQALSILGLSGIILFSKPCMIPDKIDDKTKYALASAPATLCSILVASWSL